MKAVIMAGGAGKRLRPLTCDCPKPMTPMMDRPVMAYGVELLRGHGVRDIAVTLQYLPHRVMEYFGNGEGMGVRMRYFVEKTPLGTAGSVRQALSMLDETFCVMSGDALTDIDLSAALAFHREKKALCTIVLKRVEVPVDYGIVLLGEDGRISRFYEKPGWEEIYSDLANTGVYILEPQALERIREGAFSDFAQDLFPALLKEGAGLYGCVTDAYWCDIGDLSQYLQAHRDILDGRCKVTLPKGMSPGGAYVDATAFVAPSAQVLGPCYIGGGAYVGERAHVGMYSVIGGGARVGRDASIKRGILWHNAELGRGASVRGAVLCDGAALKAGASAFEEAVVGKDSAVGSGGAVKPKVCVWPCKRVEALGVVDEDLIWSGGGKTRLFEAGAVSGSIASTLSPINCAKLGAAFGSIFAGNENVTVAVGCDGKCASIAAKAALVSGLLASGADVFDLDTVSLPILRFGMAALNIKRGAMVTQSGDISIRMLENGGATLSAATQRLVRTAYERPGEAQSTPLLGVLQRPKVLSLYAGRLAQICDKTAMTRLPRSVVLDAEPLTRGLLADIFAGFGWQVNVQYSTQTPIDAAFKISSDSLIIHDEAGRELTVELKNALISLCGVMRGVKQMYLPQETPEALIAFLKARGVAVTLCKSAALFTQMNASPEFALMWFDPAFGALAVANAMAQTGLSVGGLMALLPKAHLKSGFVDCSWREVGRILRKLATVRDPACGEGVRVRHERGWALIRPSQLTAGLNIIAEGFSEEYAQSLTDFYVKRVSALKNEGDGDASNGASKAAAKNAARPETLEGT